MTGTVRDEGTYERTEVGERTDDVLQSDLITSHGSELFTLQF